MTDARQFSIAYSRLNALRTNIPPFIDESEVASYHAIIDALQEALDESLKDFRIPDDKIKPKVIGARRGGFRGGRGSVYYSDKKYCDSGYFERQLHALWQYVQTITSAAGSATKAPKDYSVKEALEIVSENVPTKAQARGPTFADDDYKFSRLAIAEARKSVSEQDGRPHPLVGAVVVKNGTVLSTAHRGEESGNHAEYLALEKKLSDAAVSGATVYTTLEPCTTRSHPKIPCAARIIDRKVARVVIGMLDPDPRITGRGQRALRSANIITDFFPHELMTEVEELNREFTRFCERENQASKLPEKGTVAVPPERYKEWRELTDELDAAIEDMACAFVLPGSFRPGDPRNDPYAGIRRGTKVLTNRLLIAEALKKHAINEKWRGMVEYVDAAVSPRSPSQHGAPTATGYALKVEDLRKALNSAAREDLGA
jgi:pyrimidine deaminase RibD-like protein